MITDAKPLANLGLLVTRPQRQAIALQTQLEALGARVILLPTILIEQAALTENTKVKLDTLDENALLIFVSTNAVDQYIQQCGTALNKNSSPQIGAIGEATAKRLEDNGIAVNLKPSDGRYQSESLLALPALADLRGKSAFIVRGVGGKALLAEQLASRGAKVTYLEVYRRVKPNIDTTDIRQHWKERVDLVTAFSSEALENLMDLLGKDFSLLLQTPLLVVSESMQAQALRLGFQGEVLLADQVSDASVVKMILQWAKRKS